MNAQYDDPADATHDPIEHATDVWLYRPTRAERWAGIVVQTLGLMVGLSIGAALLAGVWVALR